eukprot:366330-Chlamydomonas_euryale.AAC.11
MKRAHGKGDGCLRVAARWHACSHSGVWAWLLRAPTLALSRLPGARCHNNRRNGRGEAVQCNPLPRATKCGLN